VQKVDAKKRKCHKRENAAEMRNRAMKRLGQTQEKGQIMVSQWKQEMK